MAVFSSIARNKIIVSRSQVFHRITAVSVRCCDSNNISRPVGHCLDLEALSLNAARPSYNAPDSGKLRLARTGPKTNKEG